MAPFQCERRKKRSTKRVETMSRHPSWPRTDDEMRYVNRLHNLGSVGCRPRGRGFTCPFRLVGGRNPGNGGVSTGLSPPPSSRLLFPSLPVLCCFVYFPTPPTRNPPPCIHAGRRSHSLLVQKLTSDFAGRSSSRGDDRRRTEGLPSDLLQRTYRRNHQ